MDADWVSGRIEWVGKNFFFFFGFTTEDLYMAIGLEVMDTAGRGEERRGGETEGPNLEEDFGGTNGGS